MTIMPGLPEWHTILVNTSEDTASTWNQPDMFHGSVHVATKAVCTALVSFVLLLGLLGNIMVFVTACQRRKRSRSPAGLLVLNLALVDLTMCSCMAPVFLYALFASSTPSPARVFCSSFMFLGSISALVSLLTLLAIAAHHHVRVRGRSRVALSSGKVCGILSAIWITSFVLSVTGTLHVALNWPDNATSCQMIINSHDKFKVNFILFFVSPVCLLACGLITISYSVISWVVHKQSKCEQNNTLYNRIPTRIFKSQVVTKNKRLLQFLPSEHQIITPPSARIQHDRLFPQPGVQSSQTDSGQKAMTMCVVVTVTVILCWGPLIVSQFVELLSGESTVLYQVKLCGISLIFLNSALNPYIYSSHSRQVRHRLITFAKTVLEFRRAPVSSRTIIKNNNTREQAQVKLLKSKTKSSRTDPETNTQPLGSPNTQEKILVEVAGGRNFVVDSQHVFIDILDDRNPSSTRVYNSTTCKNTSPDIKQTLRKPSTRGLKRHKTRSHINSNHHPRTLVSTHSSHDEKYVISHLKLKPVSNHISLSRTSI